MNSTVIVFFVMVGLASLVANVRSLTATGLVGQICDTIKEKPNLGAPVWNKLTNIFNGDGSNPKFINSYTYVTTESNKQKLLLGGDPCTNFFADLKVPLQTDPQANKLTHSDVVSFVRALIEEFGSTTA